MSSRVTGLPPDPTRHNYDEEEALLRWYVQQRQALSVLDAFTILSQPVSPDVFRAFDRAEEHLARFRR